MPFFVQREHLRTTLSLWSVSVVLAGVASSFYWIKVVFELRWLNHFSDKYSTGLAGYEQWLFPNWIMSHQAPSYYLPVFKNLDVIILLTALLTLPFFISLFLKLKDVEKTQKTLVWALITTVLFGFFMLSRPSAPIWSSITLLQKIQFPWRWLSVLSVITVGLCVPVASELFRTFPRQKTIILISAAVLAALFGVYDVKQSFAKANRISKTEFNEVLEAKNSPSGTSFEAWWPVWARAEAFDLIDPVIANGRRIEVFNWQNQNRHFQVDEGPPTTIRVATFYYPNWQAVVNGQAVDVGKDENGAITLPISEQSSDIVLYFREPVLYSVMSMISVIVWTTMILILGAFIWRQGNRRLRF